MSKALEKEYKAIAQADVPDLWSRIEAGLSDRTGMPESAPSNLEIKPSVLKKDAAADQKIGRAVAKIAVLRKYTGILAAGVCVAIAIPIIIMISQLNLAKSSQQEQFAAEAAPMEMADGGTAAEASKEAIEEDYNESAADSVTEETSMSADMADTAGNEKADDINTEAGSTVKEQQELPVAQATLDKKVVAEVEETYKGYLKNGEAIKKVTLYVTAAEEIAGTMVYTAVVEADESGLLFVGSKLTFTKGLYVEGTIEAGKKYQMNFNYYEDEPYFFEVSKIIE